MTRLFLQQQPLDGKFHLDRSYKKRLIKVMRMHAGDHLHVWNSGTKWECAITEILQDGIILTIVRELPVGRQAGLHLVLVQAIPKGDRFEWLIQKATELGVAEIIPLITQRTIVQPSKIESRLQRWNKIAAEAAGQSENPSPAVVHTPITLSDYLKQDQPGFKMILLEREAASPLKKLLKSCDSNNITFVVGPEGGWVENEVSYLKNAGFQPVHLGTRILRSETAGIAMAAILQYELDATKIDERT